MSNCGSDLTVKNLNGYSNEKPHYIKAGKDIDVVRVEGGLYTEDTINYNPYTQPIITATFNPAILEAGLTPQKSAQKVRFLVEKGKNVVTNIKSANFGIDVDTPTLPYDSGELDHYGTGQIGKTEELSASVKVNDGTEYTKTVTQKRGHRVYYGALDSASVDADTAQGLAASEEVITGIPNDQSIDCQNGKYWFIMIDSSKPLSFKINGFVLEPIIKQEGIEPVTGYSVIYNFYISPVKMTGIVNISIANG